MIVSRGSRKFVVSILIRPEGRMQHDLGFIIIQEPKVSILIRPEGRMQR